MKNSTINSRTLAWITQGRLAVLINVFLLLQSFGAGPPGTVERLQLDFPPRPSLLTNRPTISQPEIEFSSTQAGKLGGPEVTTMLVPSIAHLLNASDRFTLTHGKQARCRCVVRLTELTIRQIGGKATIDPGRVTQAFGTLFKGKDAVIASQVADLSTNINWSSDKVQLSVRCAVSVEIIDTKSDIVLAEDIGEETRTNTAKAISLALGALVYGKDDGQNGNNDGNPSTSGNCGDHQSRLVQLATYRAICNLLPQLDKRLLELADPPASERGLSEGGSTVSTLPPGAFFCANCGKASSTGDKFCTSCGTRLNR
ncbi:MAG TPA: zinc ribbon domain-containing protein [Candidatus Limnocylindrales bacterium]|nr:zinc ribbon domain-containing protein [Candidatus Limnocylindrales bacterium]